MKTLIRRHSVATQAEVAEAASLAAMVIRALIADPYTEVDQPLEESVSSMLSRIDQLSEFRNAGHLQDFLSADRVAGEAVEQASVMAKAAWMAHAAVREAPSPAEASTTIPAVENLIASRDGVAMDESDGTITIINKSKAKKLASGLEELSTEILSSARREDRDRISSNAVV
ncbi:MAG: hypothetical protein P4L48_23190 [Mycobacterium sp.]|nr:hypothetical protein [Mycobacterium sp.]